MLEMLSFFVRRSSGIAMMWSSPRRARTVGATLAAALLASCSTYQPAPPEAIRTPAIPADVAVVTPDVPVTPGVGSRWVAVSWSEIPGWDQDRLGEAWRAWLQSCRQPAPGWASACLDVTRLANAGEAAQRQWMASRLQPYRLETGDGNPVGLLTSYYEPVFPASRVPRPGYAIPLYAPPADVATRKPYWTRQQIDTLPQARAALKGREIAYLADPIDALVLHIQGSGQIDIVEADGRVHRERVAFAATNGQPYRSVGRYLLDRNLIQDASWPGIKAWLIQNPTRLNEVLWSNPRYVFFREEPVADAGAGPRGAQGVPLTEGRSIAVDRRYIPYGTPVWIASTDSVTNAPLQRLVLAQDTGSAITGAVRADYFAGFGPDAGDRAGRTKHPLRMWAFVPRW